jgi:hypothetical protein
MDAATLTRLLNLHPVTRELFHGVFAFDTVPVKIPFKPWAIIFNEDVSNKPGSHWIAAFCPAEGDGEYFDTRGSPPARGSKINKLLGKNYVYNSLLVQNALTSVCGQHCLYFIFQRCKGIEFKDILSGYNLSNTLQNDEKINSFVEQTFHTDQDVLDIGFLRQQIARHLGDNR